LGLKLGELLRSAAPPVSESLSIRPDATAICSLVNLSHDEKAADWRAQDMHDTKRLCIGNRWGTKVRLHCIQSFARAFLLRRRRRQDTAARARCQGTCAREA